MRRRTIQLASLGLSVAATGTFVAFKAAWLPLLPELLAALVAPLLPLLLVELVLTVRDGARTLGGIGLAGKLLVVGGALAALSAGLANWLLGVQGVVILAEGDAVTLAEPGQLIELEVGPLARLTELDVRFELGKVRLRPAGESVVAESTLLAVSSSGTESLTVLGSGSAQHGQLVVRGGAFGFAPRIVILKEGRSLFDRVVPFMTERRGAQGYTYEGSFEIEKEGIAVQGAVDLDTLDEALRGHPVLRLSVAHGGEGLGAGTLEPGHFADLPEGYRIGFAGLSRWVELLVTRRSYPAPIAYGLASVAAGTPLWMVGWLRGSR